MKIDKEKVIKALNDAITAKENYPWAKAEMSFEFIEMLLELLKEQFDKDIIVRCKDCIHRGKSEKCVLAAISEEKDWPLFMLDNRGYWFCADGKRKEDK